MPLQGKHRNFAARPIITDMTRTSLIVTLLALLASPTGTPAAPLLPTTTTQATDTATLTLEDCLLRGRDNYPAVRQYALTEKSREYTLANASKTWLPQISVMAGGYAFTDPIKTDGMMQRMGITVDNWTAAASITVRQNIYDGGQVAAARQTAAAQADVQQRRTDISMHALRERIEEVYFGILILDERLRQNTLLQEDLAVSLRTIESMVRNGTASQNDCDALQVEQLSAAQQHDALTAQRNAYLQMLSLLTGSPTDERTVLLRPADIPVSGVDRQTDNPRPELRYYAAQGLAIDATRRSLDTRLRPTLSFIVAGTWHTSVTDLAHNAFLFGGLQLSWNIGALYTRRNDLRRIELQRLSNDTERDVFLFDTRLQNSQTSGTVVALQRQITSDNEIVRLRENIRARSDRKVVLGTESVDQLLRDILAVDMARTQKALHEIQLLRELYRLRTINND